MRSAKGRKVNVVEMKRLEGVSRMDRVRNEAVRLRGRIERVLTSRVDHRVWSLFGHVERIEEYCIAKWC